MNILIVEDDSPKAEKVKLVIEEALGGSAYTVALRGSNAECIQFLMQPQKLSLLVLDLNLPVRAGEYPKKDSGLKLLKEISRRREISKPESIIGLTQYEEIHDSAKSIFDNEGWTVIKYDPKLADWEDAIKNKIYWLIEKNTMEKTLKERTKILFIASSPNDQSILNAGMEQRLIEEALQLSTQRDTFEISFKHGAKLATLTRELMQFEPQILHFTGHGDISGIAMEEDNGSTILVPNSSLERLFKLFKGKINCVILSSCYSSNQAEIISQQNMYVIGMNDTVGVVAATEFSKGFYQALGEGKSVYDSFNFGLVHLTTSDENQQDIPEIWFDGVKM